MELIAAIATPRRPSAIGIVRMSGDGAKDALSALFLPQGKIPVAQFAARHAYYGTMRNAQGRAVDRGLAIWFPAERSYTGEDCVELHCHGSPVVLDEMLRAAFHAGARQANAGEFTKRAFLNGRMDLTEAEAVADLIDAETPEMAYNALGQLNGSLRTMTEDIYAKLVDLSAHFYALVDYPDEDIEALEAEQIGKTLYDAAQTLDSLLHTAARGRILKNGIPTALIGAPNAGKSSLLNALLGYDRAIVTDIPGTTRDTVEEKINVGGVLLRLVDTAGLRQSSDIVEMIGVERSKNAAQQAQLLLALIDGSLPPNEAERETIAFAQSLAKPYLLIITHSDLPSCRTEIAVPPPYPAAIIVLSSRSGEGIPLLEEKIVQLYSEQAPPCATILTNARQEAAIARAHHAVLAAADALQNGLTHDIVLTEVEAASAALGELTGRSASEDLVSHIFERFCVGK